MEAVSIKKVQKLLSIVLLAVMMVSVFSTVVFATTPNQITADKTIDDNTIKTLGQRVVGILQAVGIVLSVVILIVIGIKYMMGSAEEKAEYKKTLMPYVIGAALIFAASMFAQSAYDFFSGLGNTAA